MHSSLADLNVASHVIHLSRVAARQEPLLQQAKQQGIDLHVFEASDGKDERFRSQIFPTRHGGTCADLKGAIFDSHLRLWRMAAAKAPGSHTLILEDDVSLPKNFTSWFIRGFHELPASYDVAMVGTTTTANMQPYAGASHLIVPDSSDPNGQAILGFFAYVVSQHGAIKLLAEHDEATRSSGSRFSPPITPWETTRRRRVYQPVDLFLSNRLAALSVFIFRPPPALVRRFARYKAEHGSPSIDSHTQLGIVSLRPLASTNAPSAGFERQSFDASSKRMGELFGAERFEDALAVADQTLGSLSSYPCWEAATMLQNTGLALLRMLNFGERRRDSGWATATFRHAEEAFASSIRYAEGTWLERSRREQVVSWINWALHHRQREGLPSLRDDTPRELRADGSLTLWPGSHLVLIEAPIPELGTELYNRKYKADDSPPPTILTSQGPGEAMRVASEEERVSLHNQAHAKQEL